MTQNMIDIKGAGDGLFRKEMDLCARHRVLEAEGGDFNQTMTAQGIKPKFGFGRDATFSTPVEIARHGAGYEQACPPRLRFVPLLLAPAHALRLTAWLPSPRADAPVRHDPLPRGQPCGGVRQGASRAAVRQGGVSGRAGASAWPWAGTNTERVIQRVGEAGAQRHSRRHCGSRALSWPRTAVE